MENISFVIWMLGWPLLVELSDWLRFKKGVIEYKNEDKVIIMEISIWVIVAIFLYK